MQSLSNIESQKSNGQDNVPENKQEVSIDFLESTIKRSNKSILLIVILMISAVAISLIFLIYTLKMNPNNNLVDSDIKIKLEGIYKEGHPEVLIWMGKNGYIDVNTIGQLSDYAYSKNENNPGYIEAYLKADKILSKEDKTYSALSKEKISELEERGKNLGSYELTKLKVENMK